ncbi:hypothetical protein QAD02_006645 [Eretmocerus hayati]|uniref:Uncharacterized protein n=1 Tax=Eretmocerus hayati TaxID=131215 RepID=A0ACC2N2M5_9HYME|nr:hypothetical protein QAD02_006645 [Eretmocerus hayati]
MMLKFLACIILILMWSSSSVALSNNSSSHNASEFGNTQIFYARDLARSNGNLLFAVCSDQHISGVARCRVTLKNIQNQSEFGSKVSCRLDIHSRQNRKFFRPNFDLKLELFGNPTKAVLTFTEISNSLWSASVYDRIIFLDMLTCATENLSFMISENYFSEISPRNRLIIHKNSFDVIVTDPKVCENFIKCIVTFDENGKRIGSPRSFSSKLVIQQNKWIESITGSQGLLVFGNLISESVGYVAAEYYDISGASKQFELTFEHELLRSSTSISSAHGIFTICSQVKKNVFVWNQRKESTVHCNQFRPNRAEPILSVTIKNPNNITDMAVHSLIGGGFIFLVQECPGKNVVQSLCHFKASIVGVREAESLGLQINSHCSNGNQDDLIIDVGETKDKFCFYFLCTHQGTHDAKRSVTFDRKCILK